MKVYLVHSEGHGLDAIINVDGVELTVMDGFSVPESHSEPGELENVAFSALQISEQSWEEIFQGNPNREKKLQHVSGSKYTAYGEITSINPTVVDFGLLTLEAGPPTNDVRCIGQYVKIIIDSLHMNEKL